MTACVFCDIGAGKAPAEVLADWPETIAFRPINPVVAGHALIVPRTHVRDATVDPAVTGLTFQRAAEWAALRTDSCNILTSVGAEATQTVFHLHVHVVPRREGDGLHLPWTDQP